MPGGGAGKEVGHPLFAVRFSFFLQLGFLCHTGESSNPYTVIPTEVAAASEWRDLLLCRP